MAVRYITTGQAPDYRVELRGTLAEILSVASPNVGAFANPEDVAGCTLEMGADGLWHGNLGDLTAAQAAALVSAGVLAKVAVGTPATVNGSQVVWRGTSAGLANVGPKINRRTSLPVLSKAIANMVAGISDAKIAYIGDSKTLGYANGLTPVTRYSYPRFVSDLLESKYRMFGGLASQNDERWTLGTGWSPGNVSGTYGIANGTFHGNTSNSVTFTPAWGAADTYDIYYITTGSGSGSATVSATGGTAVTIARADAAAGISSKTFSAASASITNTITITGNNDGDIYIIGVASRSSSKKSLLVSNFGWSGSKYADWNLGVGNAYGNQAVLAKYAPHALFISFGTNEAAAGKTVSQFIADATTLIAAYKTIGCDIVIVDPLQSSVASGYQSIELSYSEAIPGLAATLGVAYLPWHRDLPAIDSGSYNNMADTLHRTTYGNGQIADYLAMAIDW